MIPWPEGSTKLPDTFKMVSGRCAESKDIILRWKEGAWFVAYRRHCPNSWNVARPETPWAEEKP